MRSTKWKNGHNLDNTAHIYPAISSKKDPNVYRISVELCEAIKPELLLAALKETLPSFKAFNVAITSTLFWHHFEDISKEPSIHKDEGIPCQSFSLSEKDFLFRLLYNGCKIHLEVFHVLSDGIGSLQFLKAICSRYLQLAFHYDFTSLQLEHRYEREHGNCLEDAYLKNYSTSNYHADSSPKGYQMRGDALEGLTVLSMLFNIDDMKAAAHKQNATISEFITAILSYALKKQQIKEHSTQPITLYIPVNLRPIFNTETSLNFFSGFSVVFEDAYRHNFAWILKQTKQQFKAKNTRQALSKSFELNVYGQQHPLINMIPLPVKNAFLKQVYKRGKNNISLVFSNLGIVKVDSIFTPYIKGVRILNCPSPHDLVKVTAISYGDTLALTFGSFIKVDGFLKEVMESFQEYGVTGIIEYGI